MILRGRAKEKLCVTSDTMKEKTTAEGMLSSIVFTVPREGAFASQKRHYRNITGPPETLMGGELVPAELMCGRSA